MAVLSLELLQEGEAPRAVSPAEEGRFGKMIIRTPGRTASSAFFLLFFVCI